MNHGSPLILTPPPDAAQQLKSLAAQLASKYAHHELVTQDDLKTVGAALWRVLDCDAEFSAAKNQAGLNILPVVLDASTGPASEHLPWECLHHPEHGFIGIHEHFTLSRRRVIQADAPPLRKGPLRVLLFTALPDDLDAERGRLHFGEGAGSAVALGAGRRRNADHAG